MKGEPTSFTERFLQESIELLQRIDSNAVDQLAVALTEVRRKQGRVFVLGVGGSAGHASHAVSDLRKLCRIEAYAPTDNVSELTARVNDEGWDTVFSKWLEVSKLSAKDAVLIFSVGGGDLEKKVSVSLILAMAFAKGTGAQILGIVGRDGGYTKRVAQACVVIPPLFPYHVTPHTEGLCAVIWHLLVSHPLLKIGSAKWESIQ